MEQDIIRTRRCRRRPHPSSSNFWEAPQVVRAATKKPTPKRVGLSAASVLDEAAKLADERGYDQLSLAELATRFRVQPPSLYNHIDSLESLKRGLALRALRELAY